MVRESVVWSGNNGGWGVGGGMFSLWSVMAGAEAVARGRKLGHAAFYRGKSLSIFRTLTT